MNKTKETKHREINKAEFFALLEHISNQKNMTIDEVVEIMKAALIKSFHINFDPDADIAINIDQKNKEFTVTNKTTYVVDDKTLVDDTNKMFEINLKDALKIDPKAKEGDIISKEIDFSIFKNEIASQIGQLFKQELVNKYKGKIYDKYSMLKGEIVDATVISVLPQQVLFQIEGKAEATMLNYMRNNRQPLSPGQVVEVYVEDVRENGSGPQIIVSNGSKEIVKRFLEREIPEIEEGIIEVIVVARIPGYKSKIAIKSNNPNIDPTGSVIGPRGSRINSVSDHLFGERIDVIRWSGDINEFIANSISPAKAIAIVDKNEEETTGGKIVIVPNRHQTLAIGKGGTNIKLASHLTQEKLDVISLEQAVAKGVVFEWNGNVTPEEVEAIERGEKLRYNSKGYSRNDGMNSISSFDNDISAFTEDIAEFDSSHELSKEKINYTNSTPKRRSPYPAPRPAHHGPDPKTDDKPRPKHHEENKLDLDNLDNMNDMEFNYEEDSRFSDEDLKKMEEDFGFGDFDLSDFKDKK